MEYRVLRIKYKASGAGEIEFSNGDVFVLEGDKLYLERLKKGDVCNEEQFEAIKELSLSYQAKYSAANSLARTSFSKKGLERRLVQKGVQKEYAQEAAAYYEQKGYVNDRDYGERLISHLSETKLYGKRKISAMLFEKGLRASDFAEQIEQIDERSIIKKRIKKKHGNVDRSDRKIRDKAARSLASAGFSYDLIDSELKNSDEDD